MKRIILGAFLCLMTLPSFAQDAKGKGKKEMAKERKSMTPDERADMATKNLTKKLSLDSIQGQKVSTINKACAQKNDAIRKNSALSKEDIKAQCKLNREQAQKELASVLNAEQKTKYDALLAKRAEQLAKRKEEGKNKKKEIEELEEEL